MFLLTVSVLAAILLSQTDAFRSLLLHMGTWRYIGAFLGGMLITSTLTAPMGILIILMLAKQYAPVEITLLAGLGAVLCDALIFYFIRNNLSKDMKDLYTYFGGSHIKHVFHSKYFHWTLPVLGALMIATPLPDELGVSLLSLSKMKLPQFILTSFCLHTIGIFLIVSGSLLLPAR